MTKLLIFVFSFDYNNKLNDSIVRSLAERVACYSRGQILYRTQCSQGRNGCSIRRSRMLCRAVQWKGVIQLDFVQVYLLTMCALCEPALGHAHVLSVS